MEDFLLILIWFILLIFIVLSMLTMSKLMDIFYINKEKKNRLKYPELYKLYDKLDAIGNNTIYGSKIRPLEKQIGKEIEELKYLPKKEYVKKKQEIEEMKVELYKLNKYEKENFDDKVNLLRDEIDKCEKEYGLKD